MRKVLISVLIAVCAGFCMLGIVACAPEGLGTHNWASAWTSNSTHHWHRCQDSGCNGRNDYSEHEWEVTDIYEEPTCGETGLGQYTCSVCNATLGNANTPATIPATGEHDYKLDTVDVDPTCGEDGYGTYICDICFDVQSFPIPATGEHDYSGKYVTSVEGHYHACLHGCGVNEALEPHEKGEGIRFEPAGTKDGRIEYRCTVCGYLIDTEVIANPNILHHFEVKFVKVNNSSVVIVPQLGDDGELYATLSASSNAMGGYRLEFTGYNADGDQVSVTNVTLYHFDEYTGKKNVIDFQSGPSASTGYLGYVNNWFYVSRPIEDESLLIESAISGRDPVSLKVHISTVKAKSVSADAGLVLPSEIPVYYIENKNY